MRFISFRVVSLRGLPICLSTLRPKTPTLRFRNPLSSVLMTRPSKIGRTWRWAPTSRNRRPTTFGTNLPGPTFPRVQTHSVPGNGPICGVTKILILTPTLLVILNIIHKILIIKLMVTLVILWLILMILRLRPLPMVLLT